MKFRNNQSNYLYSLTDKTFYLQISIWWEDGIMPTPADPRDRTVFTGFCHGGVVTTETNKKVLECKLNDYSKILKDQFFLNSPFFDRMRDVNAVYDIMQMAGKSEASACFDECVATSDVKFLDETPSSSVGAARCSSAEALEISLSDIAVPSERVSVIMGVCSDEVGGAGKGVSVADCVVSSTTMWSSIGTSVARFASFSPRYERNSMLMTSPHVAEAIMSECCRVRFLQRSNARLR
jgi:hypothetical protein